MGQIIKDETTYDPPQAESQWLTFEEGTTTIRLLSHSYTFRSHYIKSESKSYTCTVPGRNLQVVSGGVNRAGGKWAYLVVSQGS